MSAPILSSLPLYSRPTADPPTAALPPIPRTKPPKRRSPVNSSGTPSKLRLPSSPALNGTLASDLPSPIGLASPTEPERPSTSDKGTRRITSIPSFPQPPNLPSRPGTAASMASITSTKKRTSDGTGNPPPAIVTRSRRSPRVSTNGPGSSLRTQLTPSLLNAAGDGKSIPLINHRISDGQNSVPSPPHSRSSSANGSYSTSATTFDDGDDEYRGRPREEETPAVDSKRSSKVKESKGNVIVSVRVRPDASIQEDSEAEGEWMVDGRRGLVAYRGKEGGDYHYDNVFGTHDNNAKVYDAAAKRLVRRVMEGYHGTVFAYGVTSTGKTFSMQGTATSPGVIPLAITDIFSYIRETPQREFLLRASYLEIYNEKIHDLLAGSPAGGQQEEIKLREDSKRGVYATPLKEEIVQSPTQLLRVIARGDHARRTSSTQFNARSSRSHAVVQIVVESRERVPGSGMLQDTKRVAMIPGGVRVSTLSLIDLAGSERAAEDKERRTEGAHINKSLLTLGTVIARLSGDKDKTGHPTDKDGKHLPYRDSKLTRLLQPALSGNSLISILCTIQISSAANLSSSHSHTGETLNTLKFAARAKNNIVSHAKKAAEEVGSGVSAGLLERYRAEIQSLRNQLEGQHKKAAAKDEKQIEKDAEQRHEEQMLEMQLARTALKERIEHLNRLILCSKSTGVNNTGTVSALGMHSRLSAGTSGELGQSRSVRSSASHSTLANGAQALGRRLSPASLAASQHHSFSAADEEEEEAGGEFADGVASLQAQNRALLADLQDKNRYIVTMERRLLQARRSSHSRVSMSFSRSSSGHENSDVAKILAEKEAVIADLRARLDDKERMVVALRSAARKRELADLTPETSSAELKLKHSNHQQKDSTDSILLDNVGIIGLSPSSPTETKSPLSLLLPQKATIPPRKNMDDMSKILDEMIQDKVESGHLVKSKTGSVRIAVPNRSTSRAHSRHPSSANARFPPLASMVATWRDRDSVLDPDSTN